MSIAQSQNTSSFDSLYSAKELGCTFDNGKTVFRVFAPRATAVAFVLFNKHDDATGAESAMVRDSDGVWEFTSSDNLLGKYYGYKIAGPAGKGEMFNANIVVGDPYSKAVATKNTWHEQAKTLILDTKYDWEGDTWTIPADHTKLVIYELHVRDLTAHESSGVKAKGTYKGLTEKNKTGGFSYLKNLGINAIELLPIEKFGVFEIPYLDSSVVKEGYPVNTWNAYGRNHWGYMTSYFFTPESYYATDGTLDPNGYNGTDGRAVREVKDMVKAFHKEGISVILDIVFNHVSQYDYNAYKYIDKMYYFRVDSAGKFIENSGCGNDFATERPMSRRMIVDCIAYWMQEYHIDGFRFDLATMIDWETCRQIYEAAHKINPNVILIAEPWGAGKYEIAHFSDIGWAAWNDQIRNGVKGQNPDNGLGFIFGKFQDKNTKKTFMSYVTGTLREDGGLYLKSEHSINYLESHDDNTVGDFIRLGVRDDAENHKVPDLEKNATLTPQQMKLNKLAALYLFTSQGPIMLHEGQEFARSKVIAPTSAPDPRVGTIDHNSYEKDNATNYLNYHYAEINKSLVDYYKGLIGLRAKHPIFGGAPKKAVEFIPTQDDFFIAYRLNGKTFGNSSKDFIVLLNGNPKNKQTLMLLPGTWKIVANGESVDLSGALGTASGSIDVPPTSGMVLMGK
ncbi:MAG TPA: alpha-amylase family glycosyl hydrolase [Bacteroidota bacterium]|nr:alpha-amylase family glycosyl hydrolase [Bacteroidota bacterium]